MNNDKVKVSPCVDVDINGFYPWIIRKYTESEKGKAVMVAISGEKGVGMTYCAIRHGDMAYKPRYTREGNLIIETTGKPKSG